MIERWQVRWQWLGFSCLLFCVLLLPQQVVAADWSTDIYNHPACTASGANLYPNNNRTGSVLLCLMYVCSLEVKNVQAGVQSQVPDHCQFWEKLTGKIDIGREMQDLKSYMALKELEKAKHKAVKMMEPVPQQGEQVYSGLKLAALENSVRDKIQCNDRVFIGRNFGVSMDDPLITGAGCGSNNASVKEDFVLAHLNDFCSKSEEDYNLCVSKKFCTNEQILAGTCTQSGKDINLPYDLMGSSLYRYANYSSPMQAEAAKRYVENLLAASMPQAITPDSVYAEPVADAAQGEYIFKKDGDKKLAEKYQSIALLSMAQNSLFRMYAERIPTSYSAIAPTSGYQGQSVGQSYMGTIAVESKRRFSDPRWYQELNSISDTALLREISNMYAMQLMMNYRMMEHIERIEGLMAVRNAFMANKLIGDVEKARIQSEHSQ